MKKVAVVLGWFVIINLFVVQSAQAAVIEVDVTVKSIDTKARGITVAYETKLGTKTIDLDVSRKAEITVNGKQATLDSVKPGQKAKVSYEKELGVVTKIDATGTGTDPAQEVCRFRLSVSEFGDCVVEVEQTSTPISSATKFDGKPTKLALLPNAEVLKASDGCFRIIHCFDHSDELPSIFSVHNAELDRSSGAVMFKPGKNDNPTVAYWCRIQLPAIICYDRLPIQDKSGIILQLFVGTSGIGSLGVNFGRGDDGKPFTGIFWNDIKDNKLTNRTQILNPATFDIREGCKRKFRLPLPNVHIEENCVVQITAWENAGAKSDLLRLLVQGHLHPTLGIGFGERMGVVFAQSVIHGGFAEKAGLKVGDVVLSINGQQPKSLADAMNICKKVSISDQVQIKIRRGDEEHELKVVFE